MRHYHLSLKKVALTLISLILLSLPVYSQVITQKYIGYKIPDTDTTVSYGFNNNGLKMHSFVTSNKHPYYIDYVFYSGFYSYNLSSLITSNTLSWPITNTKPLTGSSPTFSLFLDNTLVKFEGGSSLPLAPVNKEIQGISPFGTPALSRTGRLNSGGKAYDITSTIYPSRSGTVFYEIAVKNLSATSVQIGGRWYVDTELWVNDIRDDYVPIYAIGNNQGLYALSRDGLYQYSFFTSGLFGLDYGPTNFIATRYPAASALIRADETGQEAANHPADQVLFQNDDSAIVFKWSPSSIPAGETKIMQFAIRNGLNGKPPVITMADDTLEAVVGQTCPIVWQGHWTDVDSRYLDILSYRYQDQDNILGERIPNPERDAPHPFEFSIPIPTDAPIGSHPIRITAVDDIGMFTSYDVTLNIVRPQTPKRWNNHLVQRLYDDTNTDNIKHMVELRTTFDTNRKNTYSEVQTYILKEDAQSGKRYFETTPNYTGPSGTRKIYTTNGDGYLGTRFELNDSQVTLNSSVADVNNYAVRLMSSVPEFTATKNNNEKRQLLQQTINHLKQGPVPGNIRQGTALLRQQAVIAYGQNQGWENLDASTRGGGEKYQTFRKSQKAQPTLFTSMGNGLVQVFDVKNAKEHFAYLPRAFVPLIGQTTTAKWWQFSTREENFRQFDTNLSLHQIYHNNEWKNILLGGIGGQGRGVFALDVTKPATFNTQHILYDSGERPDFGSMNAAPRVAKLANHNKGKYMMLFSNGYRTETTHNPALYITPLFANEGQSYLMPIELDAINTIQQLGAVTLVANTTDAEVADYAYAGDTQGNLWRFDLKTMGKAQKVATLRKNNMPQEIIMAPTVSRHPDGGLVIYVATGGERVYGTTEQATNTTFYVIHDKLNQSGNTNVVSRNQLQARTISVYNDDYLTVKPLENFSWKTFSGWYIDFSGNKNIAFSPELASGNIVFTLQVHTQIGLDTSSGTCAVAVPIYKTENFQLMFNAFTGKAALKDKPSDCIDCAGSKVSLTGNPSVDYDNLPIKPMVMIGLLPEGALGLNNDSHLILPGIKDDDQQEVDVEADRTPYCDTGVPIHSLGSTIACAKRGMQYWWQLQ